MDHLVPGTHRWVLEQRGIGVLERGAIEDGAQKTARARDTGRSEAVEVRISRWCIELGASCPKAVLHMQCCCGRSRQPIPKALDGRELRSREKHVDVFEGNLGWWKYALNEMH